MKLLNKILKASLASLALLSTVTVSAVNRIYVEPLTVSNYEVTELKVMIETDKAATGAQLDLTLPEGLVFADGKSSWTSVPEYKDIFANAMNVTGQSARILLMDMSAIIKTGTSQAGAVKVKAATNALDENAVKQITFNSKVTYPNPTANTDAVVKDQSVNITFEKYVEQTTLNFTFSTPGMVLNPEAPRELRIAMENSMPVSALDMTLEVPAGVTISDAELIADRNNGARLMFTERPSGDCNIIVMTMAAGENAILGNSGDIVKMNLTASEAFDGVNAILKLKDIEISKEDGSVLSAQDVTMTLTAGKLAYERAALAIEELQQKLTTAINNVNEQYPLAAEAISPMDVYQQISALQSAVETAYENYTLTPNYDEVMAPVAAIEAAIDEYVEKCRVENERQTNNKAAYDAVVAQLNTLQEQYDAAIANVEANYADFRDAEAEAAAQKLITDAKARHDAEMARRAANESAYNAVVAGLDELQNQLDAALATLAEDYADYRDPAAEEAAQQLITDAKAAAQTAYEAVAEQGTFEYTADTESIAAAIAKLLTDAEARRIAELDRVQANQALYDGVIAQLDALQEQLDTTLATLAADYADFRDTDAEAAAQQMITDAKAAAQAALDAVAEEGNFDYTPDTEAISTAIAKLLTDAEARRAAELDRVQANETAHNAVIAQLDELQAQLDAALATLAEKYPTFRNEEAEQAAQQMITDAKAAADAAFEAVAEEGVYSYTPDVEAITEAITSLVPDAEQRRVDYNTNLYDQDIATVDHLQELFDQAMADIKAVRPDFEGDANTSNVQEMIEDARSQCDEELARVEEEGLYEAPAFDAEQVEAAIQAMKDNAISGISDIYVDYNGEEVIIFTMDGTRHNKPVVGQVNIFRYKNGKCVKTFVNK